MGSEALSNNVHAKENRINQILIDLATLNRLAITICDIPALTSHKPRRSNFVIYVWHRTKFNEIKISYEIENDIKFW